MKVKVHEKPAGYQQETNQSELPHFQTVQVEEQLKIIYVINYSEL